MPFLTQGKTNWKFLLIVVILAVIVDGGIFWFLQQQIPSYQPLEIKIPEKVKDETANWQTYRNQRYGIEFEYPRKFGEIKLDDYITNEKTDEGCTRGEEALLHFSFYPTSTSVFSFDIKLDTPDYECFDVNIKTGEDCGLYYCYDPQGYIFDEAITVSLSSTPLTIVQSSQDFGGTLMQEASFPIYFPSREYNKYAQFTIKRSLGWVSTPDCFLRGSSPCALQLFSKFIKDNINTLEPEIEQFDSIVKSVKFFSNDESIISPIAQVTNDWQTYRNEQYGFEMKYPNYSQKINTQLEDFNDSFYGAGTYLLQLENFDYKEKYDEEFLPNLFITYRDFGLNLFKDKAKYHEPQLEFTTTTIGGEQAYRFQGWMDLGILIPIKNGSIIITLNKILAFTETEKEIFDQMLSTFRFIEYVFPDDFILSAAELPEGFTLMQIGEREKKLGLKSNPGFWDNPEIYRELYEDVDSTKIKHLYVSLYEVLEREFGIFLVQYNSAEDLDLEIPKIIQAKEERFRFLRKEEVIAFIWTDGSNYNDLDSVADLMENRLKFEQI